MIFLSSKLLFFILSFTFVFECLKAEVEFKPHRGFHSSPFNVTLSLDDSMLIMYNQSVIVIRYIVSTSLLPLIDPSMTVGQTYKSPFLGMWFFWIKIDQFYHHSNYSGSC